jgi:hypothetical protein
MAKLMMVCTALTGTPDFKAMIVPRNPKAVAEPMSEPVTNTARRNTAV